MCRQMQGQQESIDKPWKTTWIVNRLLCKGSLKCYGLSNKWWKTCVDFNMPWPADFNMPWAFDFNRRFDQPWRFKFNKPVRSKVYMRSKAAGHHPHCYKDSTACGDAEATQISNCASLQRQIAGGNYNTFQSFGRFGRIPTFMWEMRSLSNIVY